MNETGAGSAREPITALAILPSVKNQSTDDQSLLTGMQYCGNCGDICFPKYFYGLKEKEPLCICCCREILN